MITYKAKQNIGHPFQTNNESLLQLVKESVALSQLSFSQVLHKFPILDFRSENPYINKYPYQHYFSLLKNFKMLL